MSKLSKYLNDLESNKYVKVSNLQEYKNLPIEKRSKKLLFLTYYVYWYKNPYALPINGLNDLIDRSLSPNDNGWNGFYFYIKKEFPIQYFIRERIPNFWMDIKRHFGFWKMKDFYYNHIKTIFYPFNNHSRKIIKRQYQDFQNNIVNVNFAIVKDLVEQQNEYNGVDNLYAEYLANPEISENEQMAEVDKKWLNFRQQLFNCYKYITEKRVTLLNNIENSYPDIGAKGSYEELYGKLNRLEGELEKMDSAWLNWIINNRVYFWN